LTVKRVSRDVYAQIARGDSIYDGWGANQGFVSTPEGVLVVDTGFTAGSARGLLREIGRRSHSPVRLVTNTHDLSDHVFGNSMFGGSPAVILSHSNCKSKLLEMGEERMAGYRRFDSRLKSALRGLRISLPQVTYEREIELSMGGTKLRLFHPKDGAHTKGDTLVLLPEERILLSGDVVWAGYHPNLEDANIEGWIEALENISKMDVDIIIPGHGPITDKGAVAPLANYLRSFDAQFRKLILGRTPKKRMAEELEMEGTKAWKLKMIIARNVEYLYERYRELLLSP
jgi:cyclase